MKKLTLLLAVLFACLAIQPALALESKYATGTTAAVISFAPDAHRVLKAIYSTSDSLTGKASIYCRGGAGRVPISGVSASNATTLVVSNAVGALTNGDVVCYVHVTGATDWTTVSSCTTTSVVLAAGITSAGALGDCLYEVTLQGSIPIGVGSISLSGDLFAAPGDSPFYISCSGGTSVWATATVQ